MAIDASDGTAAGDPVTLNGAPSGGVMLSEDEAPAYQTTYVSDPDAGWSSTVTAINASDGTVVGDPIALNGFPINGLVSSEDGTRALPNHLRSRRWLVFDDGGGDQRRRRHRCR